MEGIVRATYGLGWVCFGLAIVGRVLLVTPIGDRMVAMNILPRNFIQLSFLFFVISIASSVCGKGSKS